MKEWKRSDIEKILNENQNGALFLYTPFCGTCQVAGRMLDVVSELMPGTVLGKADLNYFPELAKKLSIESVPCLIIIKEGEWKEKIYAFQSVPYLLDKIRTALQ